MSHIYSVTSDELDPPSLKEALIQNGISTSILAVYWDGSKVHIKFVKEPTEADKAIIANVVPMMPAYPLVSFEILETVMVAPTERLLKTETDYEELGGVVLNPKLFSEDVSRLRGLVVGEVKAVDGSPDILLKEECIEERVLNSSTKLHNTSGYWVPFSVMTDKAVIDTTATFVLLGRKGSATEAMLRRLTLSIVKLND